MTARRGPWPGRSLADLADDIGRLGVQPGDLLMVHASLRATGPVAGGAAGVLDALADVIGPAGTLFMTLGAESSTGASPEPFDPLRTAADPDVGVLAEVFRTRPGMLPGAGQAEHEHSRCGLLHS